MFCWVRPHEKKALIEAVNGKFPLAFAKNMEDFKSHITEGDYLIFSLSKAKFGYDQIIELIYAFPDFRFYLYEISKDEKMFRHEYYLMNADNVSDGQYNAAELVNNYLGIPPSLQEIRLNKNKSIPYKIDSYNTPSIIKVPYEKMILWVNKRVEKQLKILNKDFNIPMIFVDSFEEFLTYIQPENFLVILRRKADRNIRKLRKLTKSYRNYIFYAYVWDHDPCTTPREFEFATEDNVVDCNRTDIFNLFQSL
jgi:hypothetical protein